MVAQDAQEEQQGLAGGGGAGFPLAEAFAGAAQDGCKLRLGQPQGDAQGGDGAFGVGCDVRAMCFSCQGGMVADFPCLGN